MNSKTCCSYNRMLDAKVSQEDIGAVYDGIAPIYDIWGKLTESKARDRAIALADIHDGQSILEVAVGTGLAFHEVLQRNPNGQNKGVDLSKGMLEKAKIKAQRVANANYELAIGSALSLDVKNESIDILINNYMFDLLAIEDMDKVVQEFKRVLKKDGKLVLVNMTKGETLASRIYEATYSISPKLMGGCRGVRLQETLEKHGFNVKLREYHQQMLFPSEVILATSPK